MFAVAVQARRSPASVACSAALHVTVTLGGIWAADLRAFEVPRPAKRSVTFLTVVARLPEIDTPPAPVADLRPPAPAPPAVAPAPAAAVRPEPASVHEPPVLPLDARRMDARPIEVSEPEAVPVEPVMPTAAMPPPPIAVGGFDRSAGARAGSNERAGIVVVGSGLQSARIAATPRAAAGDAVRPAGFDVVAAQPRTAPAQSAPARPDVPVEIVFKPTPAYTDEAKALRIQGEVILEVEFTARGDARVVRVVQGLGHGLDESAARAASQIRYTPARSAGRPVDVRTIVHIVFQLS
jgi:TonB family protein